MLPTPKHWFQQLRRAARSADMRTTFCSNTYKFADSPPCRSLTFFHLGIELTENQCQSVFACLCLSVGDV